MRNITQGISLSVLGLIICLVGVVTPIAWDWWNKRAQLTVETKSSISVVGRSQSLKNLEFSYNGKRIAELQRVNLIVRNAGRTAVLKEDIITPFTLTFKADEVLESTIVRQMPLNLSATAAIQQKHVIISFPLLNPDDEIELEVLLSGPYTGFGASARIKNISNVTVADTSRAITIRNDIGFGVFIAGAFGVLFLFGTGGLLIEVRNTRNALTGLSNNTHRLLDADSKSEAQLVVNDDIGFLTGFGARRLRDRIDAAVWPLNASDRNALRVLAIDSVKTEDTAGPAAVTGILSGIAIWYVYTSVLV